MSLTVDPRSIPPDGSRIEGEIDPEDLGLSFEGVTGVGALAYDLTVELIGAELLVRGSLAVPVEFSCSRCLKPTTREISSDSYSFNANAEGGEEIDLTDSIREDIIIALPLKPLCDEGCKGICPRCGNDLNSGACGCGTRRADIRWDALEGVELPPEEL